METTSKKQQTKVVRCPHCGYEYLPSEIFYPEDVLGTPKTIPGGIIRDSLGHIIYVDYDSEPMAEQDFTCDHCGKPFVATLEINIGSKPQVAELDFSEEQVSLF